MSEEHPVSGETLPFVVTLPAGWTEVDPADAGVPEAILAAVRADSAGESFSPNILVAFDTARLPVDPEAAADDSLERLRANSAELGDAWSAVHGQMEKLQPREQTHFHRMCGMIAPTLVELQALIGL